MKRKKAIEILEQLISTENYECLPIDEMRQAIDTAISALKSNAQEFDWSQAPDWATVVVVTTENFWCEVEPIKDGSIYYNVPNTKAGSSDGDTVIFRRKNQQHETF